jgi:hypothetical protein
LAPFQLLSNDDYSLAGCRGIAGPFPPPLWIRAPYGAIELCGHNIMGDSESQLFSANKQLQENEIYAGKVHAAAQVQLAGGRQQSNTWFSPID